MRRILPLLAIVAAVQSVGIARPFLRHMESNGTQFGKHARNHLKFGLGATKGIMLDVSGPRLDAYGRWRDHFYPDHGPMTALVQAGFLAVFGVREAVLRAVAILWALAAVTLFWRIARRRLSEPWDLAATALFALNPMFLYFSVATHHQVNTLAGILAGILFYLRWRESGRRRDFLGMVGAIAFACYCDWPGYYAAAAIFVAHFFSTKERRWPVAGLVALNFVWFGLYLLWVRAADPDALRMLLEVGGQRSTAAMPGAVGYVAGEAREIGLYFTVPLLALALVGIWRLRRDAFLWGLLVLGADLAAFAQIASDHDYYAYYLGPFLALAGVEGMRALQARIRWAPFAAGALFVAQAAWVVSNRATKEGAYEFYHALASAIREQTGPEDRILILTRDIRFYTPFYADRYAVWYDREQRTVVPENTGGWRQADIAEVIRRNEGGFRWVVTGDPETVRQQVRFLRGAPDSVLRGFWVDEEFAGVLRERCGPPVVRGGFRFWRMP